MSGFDCRFTEEPPKWLQYKCPICLLVLCEPYQVTCCGKSFCRGCIQQIEARNKPCPTCNQKFESFPNKGLQQPLYGFQVLCSNKERGCDWQGELGQLDQHLNSNPDKDMQLVGCSYVDVNCLYCDQQYRRSEIDQHQTSQCVQRPYACPMCTEYKSTYEDVTNIHAPVCECRPVECPNSCGAGNLQHQHLEEHISSQCPLSYVECEFSDAGCDAKVYRKDLPSHLSDNMVTHMSLLAKENRRLKLELREQAECFRELIETENRGLQLQLKEQENVMKSQVKSFLSHVPPVDMVVLPVGDYQLSDPVYSHVGPAGEPWRSNPIYSHVGGYKLLLEVNLVKCTYFLGPSMYNVRYIFLESEFEGLPPCKQLNITLQVIDKYQNKILHSWKHTVTTSKDKTFTLYSDHYIKMSFGVVFHVARIS